MKRERLGSRLGFILLSAGCAIGLGNVWRFPYMVGQNGGGAFVLIYLFFLAILGIPVMTMEFAIGRAAQKSPVLTFQQLEKKGHKWHLHGIMAVTGNYLLMMSYTTVAAWMLMYFTKMASGKFVGLNVEGVKAVYIGMLSDPVTQIIFMGFIVVAGILICSIGLQKGLERVTKFMMLALLGIMVILCVNSIFMDGGKEGLSFYLLPDLGKMKEIGIVNVIVGAMNQSFFTLSLGIGSMAIFGSYIGKERSLMGESVNIAVLDTFVAFASGLIIFPACFAYGVEPDSGKSLIFVTLPNIFNNMAGGRIWGSLFFIFLTFAAFSTVLAVFENIIACCCDYFGWSRKNACFVNLIAIFVLSIPAILGYNLLASVQPLGAGTTIMDLEEYIVGNFMLPLGSLVYVIFCVSRYGWGWDNFIKEANAGKGLKVAKWMRPYVTFVLPIIIVAIFLIGLLG